jgi:hypothetical protein
MEHLEPPLKRHLMGALPTHSSTIKLADNFKGLHPDALRFILLKAGYLNEAGSPTKAAVAAGLIDTCERKALWRLTAVASFLESEGNAAERAYVNQEVEPITGDPRWVNLGTLGTYFNVAGPTVGKWLDALDLREDDGMANVMALEGGLASTAEMNAGGNRTRKITQWNLGPVRELLLEAGHPLDRSYDALMKGKGRNSDVTVSSMEARAKEFAKEFIRLYNDRGTRAECVPLVRKTAKPIVKLAEDLLKKPGFISTEAYRKHI